MGQALHFLNNNTIQLLEVEALYNGIQSLMSGSISHYLLPHDHLARALLAVNTHLCTNQPHMVLTRMDSAYYYNDAAFRTFRHLNTLFITLDAPVTTINLRPRFQLYDVVPIPLHAPHRADYYSVLATDVQTIGFARDADHIIQLSGKAGLPGGDVWFASDPSIVILDRNKPTCARVLITSNLDEIKALCRYTIHQYPYPRLVTRLQGNTFLLTNISQLHTSCPNENGTGNTLTSVELTDIQTVFTFDCHCDTIHADEFSIVPDLTRCNTTTVVNTSSIQYPINLAYLSEYFTADQLSSLSADTLLNQTLEAELPDLTIVDKLLDEKFSIEDSAAFDMAMIINSTKTSADVYDNLAHYLFNAMITAQDSKRGFDFFSPWTWLSILGWILGVVAFILVIMLRMKVKPLFVLLMARGSQAASLGITLPKYTIRMPPTTTLSAVMDQWIKHVSHVPSLLPAEILILLCLVFAIVFKVTVMLYTARKKETARTRLVLEIGSGIDTILLNALDLPYLAKHYRIKFTRDELAFYLVEWKFGATLSCTSGLCLTNTALNITVPLPPRLTVPFWKVPKLRSLLQIPHFVTIQILTDTQNRFMDVLVLRKMQAPQIATIYPVLTPPSPGISYV